ncbi:nucleosomal histone kinase 1 [Uranotaenia lowii]|uniref:nucleosomal histone kinase 1 n=1 Tax=Uranotaenia lowii TaxID=190385 RepID=UPI00247AB603|nr:nucleosomal histone kinase 1 [Uranotaenia lowii]
MPPKKLVAGAGGRKKAANGYQMPEPVPRGTVLTDMAKRQWRIGPSIGSGGFGEIYSACEDSSSSSKKSDDYPYVVKIEPHGNGPLFVEMHFYMRNAKQDDIEKFKKSRGLKHLGMPHFVGNGSHELNNLKHRFLVMPRYSVDLWGIFLKNEKRFPLHTVYRIGLQMLDVLEYIHECTYVHADLKGANILLGFGKGSSKQQLFLVDFGLASHYTTKDFKPDPKKMHNGTIEYTSRDAHHGVPTMRGDMEILAYNVVQWTGTLLPWEAEKLLASPVKVQESKERHMKDVSGFMKYCFKKDIPKPIHEFVKYVAALKYDEKPDYNKCRKMFESGLKDLGKTNSGDLEFELKSSAVSSAGSSKKKVVEADSTESSGPIAKPRGRPRKVISTSPDSTSPDPIPTKSKLETPSKRKPDIASKRKPETPAKPIEKRRKSSPDPDTPLPQISSRDTSTPASEVVSNKLSALEPSGSIRLNTKASDTPTKSSNKVKKTYAFNFELDVSIDADVIVNVRRKKKAPASPKPTPTSSPAPSQRTRKSPSPISPSPVESKRPRRQNSVRNYSNEENSIISLNTTEGSIAPDDDTVPNSDPNTPEPRYQASRSIIQKTPQRTVGAPLVRSNARAAITRPGVYKGKSAKS